MSFGNFEFPNTSFYNSDLRELIAMYKKVVDDYEHIVSTVNEMRIEVDNLDRNINNVIDEKIQATIKSLNNQVAVLINDVAVLDKKVNTEVTNLKLYVDSSVKGSKEYVDNRINNMVNLLNNEVQQLNSSVASLKNYTDNLVASINIEVENEIEELREFVYTFTIDQVSVVNPITGKKENIQNTVNEIYKLLHNWAFNCSEYDAMLFTASEYDGMLISATDFEYMSRWYLYEKEKIYRAIKDVYDKIIGRLMVHSPITGKFEFITDVINSMFSMLKVNSLTADEYDGLVLTATAYDAMGLTAYVYDWNGLNVFSVSRYTGLTAADFARLGINEHNVVVYN